MAISNDILSSTLRILRDKEVDNLHRTTPMLQMIEELGGVEVVDGGQKVDHPVILAEHSNMTQLSTGYEPVSLGVTDPLRTASFEWCDFTAPVVITKKEELSNKGPRAIIRIGEARLKSVMGMLKREWEKQAIAGSSTVLTEMQTLSGFGATGTGWLEEAAFGAQTNSVGGIGKGTFPASWQNQVANVTGAAAGSAAGQFAANGLRRMSSLAVQAMTYAPEGQTDLILASPSSYELYKNSLFAQERYMSATETKLDGGKLALAYNGATMYIEPNLGFNAVDGGNNWDISMYFLNSKLISVYYDRDAKFTMDDFESVTGYASRAANIYVRTQLAASHLAGQGVLLNGEL